MLCRQLYLPYPLNVGYKICLYQLGVKYEMSKTDKVRPFKVIYKPTGQSDEFYDTFEDIVDDGITCSTNFVQLLPIPIE